MNVLFVCSLNQWRSPTAEQVFKNTPGLSVRSAGVSSAAKHKISEADLTWAHHVFVMEYEHRDRIVQKFSPDLLPEIHVLGIGDDFPFMDKSLVEIFETEVREVILDLLEKHQK